MRKFHLKLVISYTNILHRPTDIQMCEDMHVYKDPKFAGMIEECYAALHTGPAIPIIPNRFMNI